MSDAAREIGELWHRAADSLDAAAKLLEDGFLDAAASRAYYSAFYAASALLLSDGHSFSRHSAVLALIHRDYVKAGRLPKEAGGIINALSDLRQIADYGGPAHVGAAEARQAVTDAASFLDAVRPLLPEGI